MQTRPLVGEGAPQKQDRKCQTVINIWSYWLTDRQSKCDLDLDLGDQQSSYPTRAKDSWAPSRAENTSPRSAVEGVCNIEEEKSEHIIKCKQL
jgi:hypothetical protein